jgi:putative ABC transport system permease protein
MLIKIAWRNIWRSPLRSFVVIGAVIVGIWAIIFMNGWTTGMINGYIDNAIRNEISHLQIHRPEFIEEEESKYFMGNKDQILPQIAALKGVKAYTSRSIVKGMFIAAHGNAGVNIIGIMPENEDQVTHLKEKIVDGEYFDAEKSRKIPIIISKKTAEKLKLKIRSNVAVQFQSLQGDMRLGCKVVGIFKGTNDLMDQRMVYVRQEDLNKAYVGKPKTIATTTTDDSTMTAPAADPLRYAISHEIAVNIDDIQQIDSIKSQLQAIVGTGNKVDKYNETSPQVGMMEAQIAMSSVLFVFIIMFALIFGIVNTMLMAVLERVRELGMLMAIGMKRSLVFGMIIIETIMLSFIGAPIGMLVGAVTIYFTNKHGIDLSGYGDAMQQFGMQELIRPEVNPNIYWQTAIAIVITAILAAIYPAFKAIRLKPVDAIHSI